MFVLRKGVKILKNLKFKRGFVFCPVGMRKLPVSHFHPVWQTQLDLIVSILETFIDLIENMEFKM